MCLGDNSQSLLRINIYRTHALLHWKWHCVRNWVYVMIYLTKSCISLVLAFYVFLPRYCVRVDWVTTGRANLYDLVEAN